MKLIQSALIIGLILQAAPMHANYPLSTQSKDYIKLAAVIGATVGGGCGLAVWVSEDDAPRATFWQKVIKFGKYVLAPATIGAGIGAGIAYLTTHEANFESMEKTLAQTEIQSDFAYAMKDGTVIDNFTKNKFKNTYKLHKSCENLTSAFDKLRSLKQKLPVIINSGIESIASRASKMLDAIIGYEEKLITWIDKIQKDPTYIEESKLKTIELVGQQVANAINYNSYVHQYNAHRPPHYHLRPYHIVVRK